MNLGALAAAGVAVLGWVGVWLYLRSLQGRLQHALAELEVAGREGAPAPVTITEVQQRG